MSDRIYSELHNKVHNPIELLKNLIMTIHKTASIDRFRKIKTDKELIFNNSNGLYINYMNSM
ncbi:hypothetical protein LBBP_01925 [Leptospira borgpetersenii serovar Ballum]|uniref:Uncharacterized protein n=1 Tax=Leptospira borgpetersenii serovar Ballum TaxID=280505 RepID=A0A0E3B501_LEPBO|nr:hypothetical protein LBBP_01925 [Leptospira borgpetersenii serovar Ballum]KGE22461.1 hypothetical protein IQ66_16905 [Leptospira borgpetersenii serovar Ballum]